MELDQIENTFIQEKSLIATMLTRKPSKNAFVVANGTILIMAVLTLFYWQDPFGWSLMMPAVNRQIFANAQWWRVYTAIFIHADSAHFLSNMYMLWIFSFFVFGYFGSKIYPLITFFSAGIVNALAVSTYSLDIELLGASGLVYLLGGFWLSLYFFIQRQHKWPNRLLRVTGIGIMIFLPSTFVPTTSYRSHAIGFAIGILIGTLYFFNNRKKIRSYEVYKTNLIEIVPK